MKPGKLLCAECDAEMPDWDTLKIHSRKGHQSHEVCSYCFTLALCWTGEDEHGRPDYWCVDDSDCIDVSGRDSS